MADGVGEPMPNRFRFSQSGCTYLIEQDGAANRKCNDDRSEKFRVPLRKGEFVWIGVFFLAYGSDLILIYDTQNDGEDYAASLVVRLDGSTLKTKWRINMKPNSCPCLREDGYLYVAAWGFVGKIDLDKGRYVWSHDGRKKGFADLMSFETIRIEGNDVIFTAKQDRRTERTIRVNRTTGRLGNVQ